MAEYLHPDTGVPVNGREVLYGEVLEAGDVYASSDGAWEKCPPGLAGTINLSYNTIWVRPA